MSTGSSVILERDHLTSDSARTSQAERVRLVSLLVSLLLGAIAAWTGRHEMNADGISYIDLSDGVASGAWLNDINAYWSPLYPWLIGLARRILAPSPYWEFPVVHLVNFLIYAGSVATFDYFLRGWLRWIAADPMAAGGGCTFPEWPWVVIGYSLFLRFSHFWTSMALVTPDVLVSLIVYAAAGLLVRIQLREATTLRYAVLGLVLGIGYLAKAILFPIGTLFLAMSAWAGRPLYRALPRTALAAALFLGVSAPQIYAVSKVTGRLTYSGLGSVAYAWFVNKVPFLWVGEPPGSGVPVHPLRRVACDPDVFEFPGAVKGSYPFWANPFHWVKGLRARFDPRATAHAVFRNSLKYLFFFQSLLPALFIGICVLANIDVHPARIARRFAQQFPLVLPSLATLFCYVNLYIDPRLVAPFTTLLVLPILGSFRAQDTLGAGRVFKALALGIMTVVVVGWLPGLRDELTQVALDLRYGEKRQTPVHWEVTRELQSRGMKAGDRVAIIGRSFDAFWARLGRVQIIAEIPAEESDRFWAAGERTQAQILERLRATGARFIVGRLAEPCRVPPGWNQLGQSDDYLFEPSRTPELHRGARDPAARRDHVP